MASGMCFAGKCRGERGFVALRRTVRSRTGVRAGTATVEFALVAPILLFMLFGIIEFGLVFEDVQGINQAAREGARSSAAGAPPSTITARIAASAPNMNIANLTTAYAHRRFDTTAGSWTTWTTLGTSGTANDANIGDQIRVSVAYPHQLITRGLFPGLADDPATGTITLRAAIVMCRE